jgi:hypothetical protein
MIEVRHDVRLAQPQDEKAEEPQVSVALLVLGASRVVDRTIYLDGKAKVRAVEVDEVPGDDVLAAEFPALPSIS